jgi:hypothetical protein
MTLGLAIIGLKPSDRVASGQTVEMNCTFTVSGVPADPTKVQASIRFGTATAMTYTYPTATAPDSALVRDISGVYHFDHVAISAGTYYFRFAGFTSVQAAAEGAFDCAVSHF